MVFRKLDRVSELRNVAGIVLELRDYAMPPKTGMRGLFDAMVAYTGDFEDFTLLLPKNKRRSDDETIMRYIYNMLRTEKWDGRIVFRHDKIQDRFFHLRGVMSLRKDKYTNDEAQAFVRGMNYSKDKRQIHQDEMNAETEQLLQMIADDVSVEKPTFTQTRIFA